jgi:hypothetical protein
MNNNSKRNKPAILKDNIGAKRKSKKPKVAASASRYGKPGPSLLEQSYICGHRPRLA